MKRELMRWVSELVLMVLPASWRRHASEYRLTRLLDVEFLNHDRRARLVRFWWRYLAVVNCEEYRGQVIELSQVPGSRRAWEGMIYWDHDRGPMPVSPGRNYRQTRRQAREQVDLVLDGVSLMNELPMILAEMERDIEIKELEDGTLQWELDL